MKNIYYALLRDGLVHEIAETYLYEYLEEVAQKLEYDYVLDEVNEPLKLIHIIDLRKTIIME